jgi:hypothetical protein
VQWADASRPGLQLELTAGSQAGAVYSVPLHLTEARPALLRCTATRLLRRAARTHACTARAAAQRQRRAPRTTLSVRARATGCTQVAIGRVAANDFVINDTEVSSQHARLAWDATQAAWQLVRTFRFWGLAPALRCVAAASPLPRADAARASRLCARWTSAR